MYNNSKRPHSNFRPGGNNFRRGNVRVPKTIDPHLFVQKAVDYIAPEYTPKYSFSDFALVDALKKNVLARGYEKPTPIQDQTIPILLDGKDVVGIAATGTGKTAAFLLPLINKLALNNSERVLIIAPTRELAVQIQDEFRQFSRGMQLYSVLCIGGVSLYPQIQMLRKNPHVVIGTPGRLKDLEQQRVLSFERFRTIVLDEVDRMLDMGFIRDVTYLVSRMAKPRQSLFFSATTSINVQQVMKGFLTDPVTVTISQGKLSANVDQDIVKLAGRAKADVLDGLLRREGFDKVLVFGRTKFGMEKLLHVLQRNGVQVAAIHGNKRQSQRQRAIEDFKNNRTQVLLATDIASRGLDIDDVTHVINYDQPESYEDYIHRIGRTGRANKKGIALTFVD